MRWGLLMLGLALLGDARAEDPLAQALERFRALDGYRVTVRSTEADGTRQVVRYFYRRPGWVRMEFVEPHPGTVLIYDPQARKVQVWPFGVGRWPTLRLSPDSMLVHDPNGRRVDRSDIGVLLEKLLALRERGGMVALGDASMGAHPASGWEVAGAKDAVHYRVWLARDLLLPLKVERYGPSGTLLESVDLGDLETDPLFPEHFFMP